MAYAFEISVTNRRIAGVEVVQAADRIKSLIVILVSGVRREAESSHKIEPRLFVWIMLSQISHDVSVRLPKRDQPSLVGLDINVEPDQGSDVLVVKLGPNR